MTAAYWSAPLALGVMVQSDSDQTDFKQSLTYISKPFSHGIWLFLAAACLAKAPQEPPGSMLDPFWPPKTQIWVLFSLPRVLWVVVALFYLFPSRRCLEFLVLCGVREKRANGLRPTKKQCLP